jgi:membrane protein implicated in regulation of membrane protease activity
MGEFIPLIGNWIWWVIAGILLILELALPGVFFIWLAIPAAVVGALDMTVTLSWQAELLIFAVLSLGSVYGGRRFLARRHAFDSDQPNLNRRMFDFVGRSFTLSHAIVEGHGRITIDSTQWDVTGPDLAAGTRVKVTGVEGLRLKVERA